MRTPYPRRACASFVLLILVSLLLALPPAALANRRANDSPVYLPMPRVLVNLAADRRLRFMRVDIELAISSSDNLAAIQYHMPALRDRLVVLFGGRDANLLQGSEAREALRVEALMALRETMRRLYVADFVNPEDAGITVEERPGQPEFIDDLFFTEILVQ